MKLLLILSLYTLTSLSVCADIIYVDFDRGARGVNGRSWNQCFKYLGDALESADPRDEIWVTGGIHYPGTNLTKSRTDTFQLRSGVTVRGGYTLGQTSSIPQNLEPTILSGDIGIPGDISDNCYHVVTGTGAGGTFNGSPTLLENVTITGGNADGTDAAATANRQDVGGGLICDGTSSSPVLRNVIITGNQASRLGGGAFLNRGSPVFEQVTFSNNQATAAGTGASRGEGGAIFANLTAGRLERCVFSQNSAATGGAISNHGSNQEMVECTFQSNSAFLVRETPEVPGMPGWAGAIYNTASSSPRIDDCIFSDNTGYSSGGAVFNSGSSAPSFNRCQFDGNKTALNDLSDGGAVFSQGNSAPTFRDCSFTLNQSSAWGGALSFFNSSVSVINCSFDRNSASLGGAIFTENLSAGIQKIRYSTFHANSAFSSGGAIFSEDSPLLIQNCSFQKNKAYVGGGLFISSVGDTPNLNNCAFWGNISTNSITIHDHSEMNVAPGTIFRHCLIEGKSAEDLDGLNASSFDNFDGSNPANDPLFAPYGDYGGPTKTLPPLPGSFAIDPIGGHTANPDVDQRGLPSPAGEVGIFDIGAVEIQDADDHFNITFDIDVDGDGATNGLETAMGTDPFVPDPSHGNPIRQYYIGDGDFIDRGHWLDFPTGPRANELSLRLMRSTDLITFEPVLSNFDPTSTGTSYKLPDLEGGRSFYRLEASKP